MDNSLEQLTVLSDDIVIDDIFSKLSRTPNTNSNNSVFSYPLELEILAFPQNHVLSGLGVRGRIPGQQTPRVGNLIINRILQELRTISTSAPLSTIDKRVQLLWFSLF